MQFCIVLLIIFPSPLLSREQRDQPVMILASSVDASNDRQRQPSSHQQHQQTSPSFKSSASAESSYNDQLPSFVEQCISFFPPPGRPLSLPACILIDWPSFAPVVKRHMFVHFLWTLLQLCRDHDSPQIVSVILLVDPLDEHFDERMILELGAYNIETVNIKITYMSLPSFTCEECKEVFTSYADYNTHTSTHPSMVAQFGKVVSIN